MRAGGARKTTRSGGHGGGLGGRVRGAHGKQTPRKPARAKPLAVSPAAGGSAEEANAASIASVLAQACEGTELTPTAENLEAIRSATMCLVNQERARDGEQPLQPNGELEQAAQGHSEEMVRENYFDHVAPSGESPLQRLRAAGYIPGPPAGYAVGENIAWGTLSLSTPASIVNAWIGSPEHLANILNAAYRESAIGVDPAAPAGLSRGQAGAVYSQEFGVILR